MNYSYYSDSQLLADTVKISIDNNSRKRPYQIDYHTYQILLTKMVNIKKVNIKINLVGMVMNICVKQLNYNCFDNKTIYECKNECQNDPDCDKFLFEKNGRPTGTSNSRGVSGKCVLINNDGLSDITATLIKDQIILDSVNYKM